MSTAAGTLGAPPGAPRGADERRAGAVTASESLDRRIVRALQAGLPLAPRPYDIVAAALGVPPEEVRARVAAMLADGRIRRIGAVPNHYALGWHANGMSVWDVDDARVDALGERVGALPAVTHCYRRPRRLPQWRYNLFAMVHGRDRDEVAAKVADIADVLGDAARAHDVLFSTRILKKAGLRIDGPGPAHLLREIKGDRPGRL